MMRIEPRTAAAWAAALAMAWTIAAPAQEPARRPAQSDLWDDPALALPQTPEDAVERRVQDELDAADARIDAVLAEAGMGAAAGAETVAVDLAGAVSLALRHNPALQAVEAQRDEVAAGVVEVRADAFPQVAATSSYSLSRNPSFLNSPDFEDLLDQFPGGDFEPSEQRLYSAGVEVSQPIYTFGKIGAAVDLARLLVDAVEAQVGAARHDTALAAAEAYYEVLRERESLAVGLVQRRVRREALEVVRARYELGEATRLELLRAQSAVAEVIPTIAEQAGDLAVARSRLRNVLGLAPGTGLVVTGGVEVDLPALGRLPGAGSEERVEEWPDEPVQDAAAAPRRAESLPPVPDLTALWRAARAARPEIADLELQREALAKRQTVTRAEGRPQVELDGFFGRQARLYENLGETLYDDYSLALGVRWEFFDGGRRRGRIAQLESQRQQLGHQLRDLLDGIRLELEESLAAYRTERERWLAAETAATAAREASRVARTSYREGVALQTDWLDAQRQETEAEILAVEAYYDARREAARLARAVGAYPTEEIPTAAPGAEDMP
jgi:HAE1 family hydrophobic/amphiphilic exporter-1